jgi:hypothetical protein
MGGLSPQALPGEVPSGSTVDISVEMKAPGGAGAYRGDWKLRNPAGVVFGIGSAGDEAFWVKIKVEEGAAELNLGSPTWRDTLDSSSNWYLLNTANTEWEIGDAPEDGRQIRRCRRMGPSNRPSMDNYYLQATVTGGDCPASTVTVFRPDPNQATSSAF